MPYRDPFTGKFISRSAWEELQEFLDETDDFDDEDFNDAGFDSFDEGEY